jgi:hypothetical protein
MINVWHSLLIIVRVCGHPCSEIGKPWSDKCAALPDCYCASLGVWRSLHDLWQSAGVRFIPASVCGWTEYDSDRCAAQDQVCGIPCLTCGRVLVCGLSLPVSLSRTWASVRISLLVLWKCACDSALVLWKYACDSALVRYQRILYTRSTGD